MDNSLIKELSPEKHQCSHQTVSLSGVSHLMEKVRPNSFSGLHLSRRTFPYSTGLSSSSTGKVSESLFESSSVSVSENSYCSPIFTTARSFEFSSGRCSTWSPSHSTTSFLSTPTTASQDWDFPVPIIHQDFVSLSSMVDCSKERFERPTSVLPSPKSNFVHGCLQSRLGSLSGRSSSLGSMDSRSSEGAHQFPRNESSSCTVSSTVPSTEQVSCSCIGQHHNGCIFAESRRNSLLQTVPFSKRNPSSLRSSSSTSCSSSCSRETQCFSRFSFENTSSSQYRVGTSPISFSGNYPSMGVSTCRSVCDKSQLQTPSVCFSGSRSKSLRGRCHEFPLGRNVCLRFPSIQVPVCSSSEDFSRTMFDHSYCSSLAQTSLVSRSSSPILHSPTGFTSKTQSSFPIQGQDSSSQPREATSVRMTSLRDNFKKRGFSEGAARHLSRAVRFH